MRFSRHRGILWAFRVLAVVCFLPGLGLAATFHVSPHGSNTPPYDSYAKAAHEVAGAVAAATGYGDTVLIHAGWYSTDTTIRIPEGLTFAGVGRDSVALIWGNTVHEPGRITDLGGDNELYGIEFHWPGGNTNLNVWGLSTYNNTSIVIHHCRFYHLQTSFYGQCALEAYENEFLFNYRAIALRNAETWIHDNVFRPSKYGGTAITTLYAGSVLIEHSHFDRMSPDAWNYQGILVEESGTITVRNNLILNSQWPLTIQSSSGIIENNTIVAAGDEWHSVLFRLRPQDSVLCRNNIMQDHTMPVAMSPACSNCPPTSGPITFLYNAYWPPVDSFWVMYGDYYEPEQVQLLDSANFNAYPMFTYDSAFNLQRASPLIDTGDPAVLDPDGSRSDIGWTGGPGGWSYEYAQLPPLAPESLMAVGHNESVTITWAERPEADLAGYKLYRGEVPGFYTPGIQPHELVEVGQAAYLDRLARRDDSAFYVLVAYDDSGLESAPSTEAKYSRSGPQAHAPVVNSVPQQLIAEGDTLRLEITAADIDGDEISFRAGVLPRNGELVDGGQGHAILAFRPDTTQAGQYVIRVFASDGVLADTAEIEITVIDSNAPAFPPAPRIIRTYPNPMNNSAVMEVEIPATGTAFPYVEIAIYNILGQFVTAAYRGPLLPGRHAIRFSMSDGNSSLASGVYFARMSINGRPCERTIKLVVVR
jgi:hypothetical protein